MFSCHDYATYMVRNERNLVSQKPEWPTEYCSKNPWVWDKPVNSDAVIFGAGISEAEGWFKSQGHNQRPPVSSTVLFHLFSSAIVADFAFRQYNNASIFMNQHTALQELKKSLQVSRGLASITSSLLFSYKSVDFQWRLPWRLYMRKLLLLMLDIIMLLP